MPFYLTRFSYTPETWARLMKNPEDRRETACKYIESVGRKLHGFWYEFGAYDGYNLWEAPDNVSMAAVAIAIGGDGALSKFETTPAAHSRGDPGGSSPCSRGRLSAARSIAERARRYRPRIAYRKDGHLSPAGRRFVEIMRAAAKRPS
jgi:uncharacterized protein with GYD domain